MASGLFLAGRADAAELSVRGPRECPDTAELSFRVERLLGMPLIRAAVLHFEVEFVAAPAAYGAHLVVRGARMPPIRSSEICTPRAVASSVKR